MIKLEFFGIVLTSWLKHSNPGLLSDLLKAEANQDIDFIAEKNRSCIEKFCVVFLDLSGFAEAAAAHGDFSALRLVLVAETMIDELSIKHGGELLKSIGDSWLLIFEQAKNAFSFMESLYSGLNELNQNNKDHLSIVPCGGLAYGPLLKFGKKDIFGKTVNTAAVAGEDAAGPWEIFIAESALDYFEFDVDLNLTGLTIGGEKIYCWTPVVPETMNLVQFPKAA
jgi:class 3 adenylate cyclase